MLTIDSISKTYPNGTRALDAVTIDIPVGMFGLLGPNGAGKSTLMRTIATLQQPDSGRIEFDGIDVLREPDRLRRTLGYLPQEASIFRRLSVRHNIEAILELRSDLDREQRSRELERLMEEFNVAHLSGQMGSSLSGGERRRVEIARALAADPRFILLDEPFAGVDPISVGEIQHIVAHLRDRDIGILITDHNVRETLGICDRAYIISEGRVLTQGPPDAVLADEEVRNVYLGKEFRL